MIVVGDDVEADHPIEKATLGQKDLLVAEALLPGDAAWHALDALENERASANISRR